MWFDGWDSVGRTALTAAVAYVALVVMLRATGKRTLSKMNVFDFVVTIALGSILASVILLSDVTFADGLAALLSLILLQFGMTWLQVRVAWFEDLVKAEPTLLAYDGLLLRDAMRHARITEREVHGAVRSAGYAALDDVEAVVLETNGTFSVITSGASDPGAMQSVQGLEAARRATSPEA